MARPLGAPGSRRASMASAVSVSTSRLRRAAACASVQACHKPLPAMTLNTNRDCRARSPYVTLRSHVEVSNPIWSESAGACRD